MLRLGRPVRSEIDALKDGGNSRRAKRARLNSSIILEVLSALPEASVLRGVLSVAEALNRAAERIAGPSKVKKPGG